MFKSWDPRRDPLTFKRMESIMLKLGYGEFKNCCYLLPRMTLEHGLREVNNDDDFSHMLNDIKGAIKLHIYVSHIGF